MSSLRDLALQYPKKAEITSRNVGDLTEGLCAPTIPKKWELPLGMSVSSWRDFALTQYQKKVGITSGNFGELLQGWHCVQLVRVVFGRLALGVASLDLLAGARDAALEDAAQGDNWEWETRNSGGLPGMGNVEFWGITGNRKHGILVDYWEWEVWNSGE